MASAPDIEHRVLYRDPHFYASFPSVAMRGDGTTLLAFRRARDHRWLRGEAYRRSEDGFNHVDHLDARSQTVLLALGPDGLPQGEPWTVPPDPQAADQDASLLVLRDGRILLAGFCWYPVPAEDGQALRDLGLGLVGSPLKTGDLYLFWGGYTRHSDDGGRSWSPHRFLPALPGHPDLVPGQRPFHGGAVRGRAVEAPDGTLLLTGYTHHPVTGVYASHLFASADRGESWQHRSVIAFDPEGEAGFCETALHLDAGGGLTAFHRTTGLEDSLATSRSTDLGRSWEPWRRHAVVGHPYDACPLPDGRLLVCRGYRHKPYGIRARVYDPLTQAIDDAPEIIVRDDGPAPDLGYPWAGVLPDGRAMITCYIADSLGVRGIEASLFAPG
ncbi:exo-alpha-sialidase [Azospirillum doebereinerae]|uniref:Exo-alpha-sialidase n=1 Tax=Azospirillum doebereinerae TaxID=92933 RepID=A0A433J6U3_9PROT|nr:sialidase family protein [Azospirillum doebereinerae]RUQ68885.1 exo-alpha-sialidase [Azospirillum doebereinerae]